LNPNDVIAVLANPYPAVSVAGWPTSINGVGSIANGVGAMLHIGPLGAYHQSVRDGTEWLVREVAHESSTCPVTKLVLTGYSQGAQAIADFWQRDVTRAERAHIVGVVLFGDPYFNSADTPVDRGTASAEKTGFHGVLGTRPIFATGSAGKVLSYCELWDPICDAAPNKAVWAVQVAAFHKVHTTSYPLDGKRAALALVPPAAANPDVTLPYAAIGNPQAIAVAGNDIFVANGSSPRVYAGWVTELSASTGALVKMIGPSADLTGPRAMAVDWRRPFRRQ
jgi:hypothetical protein